MCMCGYTKAIDLCIVYASLQEMFISCWVLLSIVVVPAATRVGLSSSL